MNKLPTIRAPRKSRSARRYAEYQAKLAEWAGLVSLAKQFLDRIDAAYQAGVIDTQTANSLNCTIEAMESDLLAIVPTE